jgi:hypothetical protein
MRVRLRRFREIPQNDYPQITQITQTGSQIPEINVRNGERTARRSRAEAWVVRAGE